MRLTLPLLQLVALIKFFGSVTLLSALIFYLMFSLSPAQAVICSLLTWSLYVLCLPGSHGSTLIGFPVQFIYGSTIITEPYIWTFMAMLNIITIIFAPHYYFMSLPTQLLYSIIMHPFPCWLIFFSAFVGTFFHFFFGKKQLASTHGLVRQLTIIGGYFIFLYLSHKHIVTILGVSINP